MCPKCGYMFKTKVENSEITCIRCKSKLRIVKKNNDIEVEVI